MLSACFLQIKNTDSLISVWSILNVVDIYPFNNTEKELIKNISKENKGVRESVFGAIMRSEEWRELKKD